CEKCAFLHSSICLCPMDYLAVLVVQAVETVDQRRKARGESREKPPESATVHVQLIERTYMEAAGSWRGCDWPTFFGKSGLNLDGWTSAEARAMIRETLDVQVAEDWHAAAEWLAKVEDYAQRAEAKAAEAMEAVVHGDWRDAVAL